MKTLVHHNGQQVGPFDLEDLRGRLAAGTLFPTDLAWQEGMPNWVPLSSIPGVMSGAAAAPPPISAASGVKGATSGMAITSLVLGILSCLCGGIFLGIPAIILGHVSRSQIRKSRGSIQGDGIALAGLVTGYVGTFVVGLAVTAALVLPAFSAARERALEASSIQTARKITTACMNYAIDHRGKFPDTLDQLVPDYLPDAGKLSDPSQSGNQGIGYDYYGKGLVATNDPTSVLLTSKHIFRRNFRVVAHFDASVSLQPETPALAAPASP